MINATAEGFSIPDGSNTVAREEVVSFTLPKKTVFAGVVAIVAMLAASTGLAVTAHMRMSRMSQEMTASSRNLQEEEGIVSPVLWDSICNHCEPVPGPKGEQGMKGNPGMKGDTGSAGMGTAGPKGSPGMKGDTGSAGMGTVGPKGSRGMKGDTGSAGMGTVGPKGSRGMKGDTGSAGMGTVGPKGSRGMKGDTGSAGMGTAGPKGDPGMKGDDGECDAHDCWDWITDHIPHDGEDV